MVNEAEPVSLLVSAPVAVPPTLVRVNACEAVLVVATVPYPNGAGLNDSAAGATGLIASCCGWLIPLMMACGLVPSGLASLRVPPSSSVQYTWLASAATPSGASWPPAIWCGLVPSRFAAQTVPCPALDRAVSTQNTVLALTATASGWNCWVTMACGSLPSRLAVQIAPAVAELSPTVVQYRWLASAAIPNALSWPVTMACGALPSRPASQTAPPLGPPMMVQ